MSQSQYMLPAPTVLGFPDQFTSYRAEQTRAIIDVTESAERVRVVSAPTGIGKSVIGITIPVITQGRGLILTSTRILQRAYMSAAEQMGMRLVQGASNYRCVELEDGGRFSHLRGSGPATADRGPCKSGVSCPLKDGGGCEQYDDLRAAAQSDLVIGNYMWWLSNYRTSGWMLRSAEERRCATEKGEADDLDILGNFDYLILDEAHAAEDHVSNSLHIDLEIGAARSLLDVEPLTSTATVAQWAAWGAAAMGKTKQYVDELALTVKVGNDDEVRTAHADLVRLRKLQQTLEAIRNMRGRWVVDHVSNSRMISFDPIWADSYAEERLYRGIPNIILMSATILPAEMKYLGITQFDYFDFDSPFHITRRPVWQWPVTKMFYKMTTGQMKQSVRATEQLMLDRSDRKGIIHSVSYKRAREIQQYSSPAIRDRLLLHAPTGTAQMVERFKRLSASSGAALLSPSISTGYDFPGEECEYIIIPKVPYPPMTSPVMIARTETDKQYSSFYAAKQIVQMAGRGMRSMEDRCETIITDSTFGGLLRNVKLFPKWFLHARRWTSVKPPVARKL